MGEAPGELIFIGDKKMEKVSIQLIDYDSEHLTEYELQNIKEGARYKETKTVTWINFHGLHDTELIRAVGDSFGLHPLTLEDILNTGQQPKLEEQDDYLFIVLKMMRYDETTGHVRSEQLSMVLGKTFILTFQERPGDVFEPVRKRIRQQKGRIRKCGVDYLAYSLLDTIVDNYFHIVQHLGEKIEDLEDVILENPTKDILSYIYTYKREMNYLRKNVRPVREFILRLTRLDSDIFQEQTAPFIKDLLDISNQAMDAIDLYRDMLSDQLNIYNTAIGNRLNEIMKVLTIFSAVFIPMTFIAGVYGTNFEYLPELKYRYSYFIFLGFQLIVAITMLGFFKRKRWL